MIHKVYDIFLIDRYHRDQPDNMEFLVGGTDDLE